ncbi:MAG: sigma-54-dependent Fis family transcriptional regulator [Planctomycetia bacterium]|nr:sigma-54-dependent Fis family transcriptional regulator [Planctomycetia bacterium]
MNAAQAAPTLLVVDDDPDILLAFIDHAAGDLFQRVEVARTGAEGLDRAARLRPDVILLDVHLPDISGLDVLCRLKKLDGHCPVLIITASNTTDTAIEAVKRGAFEYLIKPPELGELRQCLARALEVGRQMKVPALIAESEPTDDRADAIIGRCRPMREVYKAIGQVAERDVTVLILGESGTGKELVARAIYQHSKRAAGPFLAINCAAIPETLLESELFGHEQGAFTGAVRRRIGKFEQCSGGTLFLDEVGDLSPATQGKVLRLLQEQRFERLGGADTIQTDVRIVAATNRDLESMVREGLFRADLYYRLSVCEVQLPPLRERNGDLTLLVHHFLERFGRELNKRVNKIVPEAMALLERYSWPGNIRELQNVLRQAMLRATGDVLVPAHLPEHIRTASLSRQPPAGTSAALPEQFPVLEEFIRERLAAGTTQLYAEVGQAVDRRLLTLVLAHTEGNQLKAAQLLGVTRRTLRNKLRDLGLRIAHAVEGEAAEAAEG